jgi:biopolymer transport protein ExbB/TolQ
MLELFQRGGWVAWPLGLFSIVGLGIILERLYTLMQLKRLEDNAYRALQLAFSKGDSGVLESKEIAAAPVTQVMKTILEIEGASVESIQQVSEIALSLQRLRLRRYLTVLATIGSTAPFIGLFGTVLGVMAAFQAMGKSGLSGEAMAAGISEALSATALGLLVAIPSVIAYNFLLGRVQGILLQIHSHVAHLTPLAHSLQRAEREVKGDAR